MADYIYSRVSTEDQSTQAQLVDLCARYPGAEVVSETASGAKKRPMLAELISRLEAGDRLIVAALDRLGRRCSEVLQLLDELERRKVVLVSVREGIDYATPTGRFVAQIFAAFAEMERRIICERVKAGLVAAQARGVKLGRPRCIDPAAVDRALELMEEGMSSRLAGRETGISHAYLNAIRRQRAG